MSYFKNDVHCSKRFTPISEMSPLGENIISIQTSPICALIVVLFLVFFFIDKR